jgi:hypothetical protein
VGGLSIESHWLARERAANLDRNTHDSLLSSVNQGLGAASPDSAAWTTGAALEGNPCLGIRTWAAVHCGPSANHHATAKEAL